MRESLLSILACPNCSSRFELEVRSASQDHILEGELNCDNCGERFDIIRGIPRLLLTERVEKNQKQVGESFGEKWDKLSYYGHEGNSRDFARNWFFERYYWKSDAELGHFLQSRELILDAGTGLGYIPAWFSQLTRGEIVGIDLSESVEHAFERTRHLENVHIIQGDILNMPFKGQIFDFILSDGVLHHTPDTHQAFEALAQRLKKEGRIAIYVYRKKGPVREFCDDLIRQQMTRLSAEECWKLSQAFTRFGQSLARLNVKIEVPEDLPVLDIPKGRYDLQRFIYWHFFKCFWKEDFSFDENNLVNFDWYHPQYAHRHDPQEMREWFEEAGLEVEFFQTIKSGVSVIGLRI